MADYRALLDYGQYYAARSGSEAQSPTGRRVLFSATGWHNPPGVQCRTQIHLVPRDLAIDAQGRLTFNPIPEIASLRVAEQGVRLELTGGAAAASTTEPTKTSVAGSRLELVLNCSGTPIASSGNVVALRILANPDQSGSWQQYTEVGYNYSSERLFVDHTHTGAKASTKPPIVQTAPLRGGAASDGGAVEIYILVDNGLVESFANRRAVISSFASELMGDTTPAPADRAVFVAPVPDGVTCAFAGWPLISLM